MFESRDEISRASRLENFVILQEQFPLNTILFPHTIIYQHSVNMVRPLRAPSNAVQRKNKWLQKPKKRKSKKLAERPATTPARTRHHFEDFPHYNNVVFTQVAHNNSRSQQKRELERHEID